MQRYFISLSKYIDHPRSKDTFPSKRGVLIKSCTLKENAYFEIEEFIQDYIKSNQGEKKFKFYNDFPGKYEHKEGFLVIRYIDCIDKYTVYERIRDIGTFYNGYKDVPHFDISMQTSLIDAYQYTSADNQIKQLYTPYTLFTSKSQKSTVLTEFCTIFEEDTVLDNYNQHFSDDE